jgi:pimeloyl-ACP methyl ester carboxylesterase
VLDGGGDIIVQQVEIAIKAMPGMTEQASRTLVGEQKRLIDLVKSGAKVDALRAQVRKAFDTALRLKVAPELASWTKEQLDAKAAADVAMLDSPWMRSFVKTDPKTFWSKVHCPILELIGERDTQVLADPNLEAIAKALGTAPQATLRKLPELNHLFQHAKTGMLEEYAAIEETFDPATLELIASWIKEHTK